MTDMEAKARELLCELSRLGISEMPEPLVEKYLTEAHREGMEEFTQTDLYQMGKRHGRVEGMEEAAKERTLPYTDRQQARISVWEQAQDSMAAAIREKINDM